MQQGAQVALLERQHVSSHLWHLKQQEEPACAGRTNQGSWQPGRRVSALRWPVESTRASCAWREQL